MTEIALAVLEIAAVLLTLLFIGIQYLSRQIGNETVPETILTSVAGYISTSAALIIGSSFFGTVVISETVADDTVVVMIWLLFFALLFVTQAVRTTAMDISELLDDETRSTGRVKSEESQETLEEYEK